MNRQLNAWRRDEGSIDLIQVFVGILIISIAAIGTFQSLFYGYEQLDYQMRYRKAISIARAYAEYWQGRIHTDIDLDDLRVRSGNLYRPQSVLLDQRDPSILYDDVYCEVAYGPLSPKTFSVANAVNEQDATAAFYEFEVYVYWYEPEDITRGEPHEIAFHAAMAPAAL